MREVKTPRAIGDCRRSGHFHGADFTSIMVSLG
jgi:hypothetical protein